MRFYLITNSNFHSYHSIFILLFTLVLQSSTTISFTAVGSVPLNNNNNNNNNIPPTTTTTTSNTIEDSVCPSSTTTILNSNSIHSSNNNNNMKFRTVQKVLPRPSPHWVGDGFRVYPVFDQLAFTNDISPFLMFDYGAPRTFPPRPGTKVQPYGVGQHPHRGFETVTIAYQGEVEHHDNTGNTGVIHPGDVQWMTAGRGILHEEYHSKEFTKTGGTFEMCQLWVNLPKQYKMTKPNYQGITNAQIPVVSLPLERKSDDTDDDTTTTTNEVLGTARIIAGELGSTKGAATTFSPIQVWDIELPKKDSVIDLPYPSHHRGMIFVRRGSVEILNNTDDDDDGSRGTVLQPQEVGILRQDAEATDTIRVRVLEQNSSILVMGGEPLNEPIAAQGPFVMNTQNEIVQAMNDYRSGKFTSSK